MGWLSWWVLTFEDVAKSVGYEGWLEVGFDGRRPSHRFTHRDRKNLRLCIAGMWYFCGTIPESSALASFLGLGRSHRMKHEP